MTSNTSNDAQTLALRGISLLGLEANDTHDDLKSFLSQYGEVNHFYQELHPGTTLKTSMCHVVYSSEDAAVELKKLKKIKIGKRKLLIKELQLENAQKIIDAASTPTPKAAPPHYAKCPQQLTPVREWYSKREEFACDFYALINADRAEAEDQARKTQADLKHYEIKEQDDGRKLLIEFIIGKSKGKGAHTSQKFKKGDWVLFMGNSEKDGVWRSSARILSSPGVKCAAFVARLHDGVINDKKPAADQITIHQVYLFAPFNRQARALAKISQGEGDGLIVDCILGIVRKQNESHELLDRELIYECGSIPMLNASQQYGIRMVLSYAVSILQGPPGTGKTNTIAVLVFILLKILPGELILVVAPSNVAADEACLRIAKTGLSPVRIYSKSHEEEDKLPCQDMALHVLTLREGGEPYKRLKQKEKDGKLRGDDERTLRQLEKRAQEAVLKKARVFVTTCCSAGIPIVEHVKPTTLIHDEASQATLPEALVPIMTGIRRLVLVGDHKQLPPLVLSQRAEEAGLGRSLLEKLIAFGTPHTMLNVQYRMHPQISAFPNCAFYNGELEDKVDVEWRQKCAYAVELPGNVSAGFVTMGGQEERHGTSYSNETQAAHVLELASILLENNVAPSRISVITFYDNQTNVIRRMIREAGESGNTKFANESGQIEVANVDSFQGRENDYVIVCTVRSNSKRKCGFLKDWRRLNVSITRAKGCLVIVGDAVTLSANATMHTLLQHYQDGGLLFEGSPGDYKIAKVNLLAAEKPSINERWERDATDLFEEFITLNPNDSATPFMCWLCKTPMVTAEEANKHLNGDKHIKQMGKLAERE